MLIKEFNTDNNLPIIIFLHGGGLSWWSYKKVAELLKDKYRIITPINDGHGEDSANTFISIEDSANKLVEYIDSHLNGRVYALGGLSIGAQIVTEILSQRSGIAKYAVIESALVYPVKTAALTASVNKVFYGLIKKKWFSRMQAKALSLPDDMFENYYNDSIKMTKQSLINIALSNGNYNLKDSIYETQAKVLIIAGGKEISIMKKSAEKLSNVIPGSELNIAENLKHGELSLAHPKEYVEIIENFFNSI